MRSKKRQAYKYRQFSLIVLIFFFKIIYILLIEYFIGEIMYKKLILLTVSMFITNICNASNHDNVVDPHKNGPYCRPALQIITKYGDMDSASKKVIKTVVQQELKQGLEVNPERVRNLAVGRGYKLRGDGAKSLL